MSSDSDIQPDPSTLGLVEAAQGFAAIGSEPRLEVLLALVRAGPGGLKVGEIQKRVDIPASTLTHHLRFLAAAGLILMWITVSGPGGMYVSTDSSS